MVNPIVSKVVPYMHPLYVPSYSCLFPIPGLATEQVHPFLSQTPPLSCVRGHTIACVIFLQPQLTVSIGSTSGFVTVRPASVAACFLMKSPYHLVFKFSAPPPFDLLPRQKTLLPPIKRLRIDLKQRSYFSAPMWCTFSKMWCAPTMMWNREKGVKTGKIQVP